MSQPPLAVEARDLTKTYGNRAVVRGISLTIEQGLCYGLLGPNGAGKSTTMRMLGCLAKPASGVLSVFGLDSITQARKIKARLGVVPQEDNLDPYLTAAENVQIHGTYFQLHSQKLQHNVTNALAFVKLQERQHHRVNTLSGGMRRRLLIARALVSQPDLLLLDEPSVGLDPQARQAMWELVHTMHREQRTIILSTHYMDEAEQLCDQLIIMNAGKVVAQGSPTELINKTCTRDVVEVLCPQEKHAQLLLSLTPLLRQHQSLRERLLLFGDNLDAIMQILQPHDQFRRIVVRRCDLEDVYLLQTGNLLAEESP